MDAKSVKIVSGNYTYIFNTEKKSNSSHQEMLEKDKEARNKTERDSKIVTRKKAPNDSSKIKSPKVNIGPFEEMATLGDPGFIGVQTFGGRNQNRMVTGKPAQFHQNLPQNPW